MRVHLLEVFSFRLFEKERLEFLPGLNWIVGDNAKGKTSLLEALYLLMAGKSFRTKQWADLIRSESAFFHVGAHFEKNGVMQKLKVSLQEKERKISHNNNPVATLSSLLGILQGVLLAPGDIELIQGERSVRRHFLDLQIAQVDSQYVRELMRYAKGIKHRNELLRTRKMKAIEVYEQVIAESAFYIMQERRRAVQDLGDLVRDFYQKISGQKDSVSLRYQSALPQEGGVTAILEKFKANRQREMELGYTLMGPHRDELKIFLKERDAHPFASEGEMRSLAAALRLAEWERMRHVIDRSPLLLVDDFGISLDPRRLQNLVDIFESLGQVIITCPKVPHSLSLKKEFHSLSL